MESGQITIALGRAERGEAGASEELWKLVYDDLKGIAARRCAALKPGDTLQATALVNEAWMRLQSDVPREWDGRAHFFGAAAVSMRNILVDQARKKQSLRRGGGARPAELDIEIADLGQGEEDNPEQIIALDEAMNVLATRFERPAKIMMLRYFAGQSVLEVAELLGISDRLVERESLFARTWLRDFIDRREG
jgi:RNA polymerase sigma factor (TIGR02999 family)